MKRLVVLLSILCLLVPVAAVAQEIDYCEQLSKVEKYYQPLELSDAQKSYTPLTLPPPPVWATSDELIGLYGKLATVSVWNVGRTIYIHVQPSSDDFWLCSSAFYVYQGIVKYDNIKIETEDGFSFCKNLYTPQTFYFTQWEFEKERFNPAESFLIMFNGGISTVQTIHYKPNSNLIPPCPAEKLYASSSQEIKLLRYFRDVMLSNSPAGQELIGLYYQWSPFIVKAMEEDEEFKQWVKETIDNVLPMIEREVE